MTLKLLCLILYIMLFISGISLHVKYMTYTEEKYTAAGSIFCSFLLVLLAYGAGIFDRVLTDTWAQIAAGVYFTMLILQIIQHSMYDGKVRKFTWAGLIIGVVGDVFVLIASGALSVFKTIL